MAAARVRIETAKDPVPFGKYLLRRIAQGRLSSVHRAELRGEGRSNERFAIKCFAPELSQDRRFSERAARVLARAAQIKHPAHCAIAEVDRAEDTLYAALEWVAGKDLKRIAVALRERGQTMPAALVAYLGAQVAEVLAEAHGLVRAGKPAPLLHGELSAVDILIGYDGRVRLIGLGSAELAVAAQVDTTRTAYHAPEISLGAACSEQTDVFALGACMYQVLSLKSATDSGSERRRADSHITQIIPSRLKEIVDRALAIEPSARWQSAAELAHQLQSWCSSQTQPADADALAAFMRRLFDGVRDDEERTRPAAARPQRPEPENDNPWNGAAEHTPAQGVLMQQLAAEMTGRAQPVRQANDAGDDSILQALVNPTEPELVTQPHSQTEPAVEGWDDPWEEDAHESPWLPKTNARAVSERAVSERVASVKPAARSSVGKLAPRRLPAAPIAAPTHVPAQPVLAAPPVLPEVVATQQPAPPALLESWQTERRAPWLVPSVVAAVALGLLLAGLFLFGGESREVATSAEPAGPRAAKVSTPAPARAEPVPQDPAPNAAIDVTDTQPSERPRATRSAPRSRRERTQAPTTEADGLTAEPEQALAPAETEQLAVAPSIDSSATTSPVQAEPTPLMVAATAKPAPVPAPVAPAKPAATVPSASRGPTRAAVVITQIAPRFPIRAKRMDITEGVVTIEFTIDKNGAVKDAVVVAAEPKRVFEDAALTAIGKWKYQPKLVNGTQAESRQRFTFRFE